MSHNKDSSDFEEHENFRVGLTNGEEESSDDIRSHCAKRSIGETGTSHPLVTSRDKTNRKDRKDMEGGEPVEGGFLNEDGLDVDLLKSDDNFMSGDYNPRFVDDEEEFVTAEQV